MVELYETVIYFLVGIKTFEISACVYIKNRIFFKQCLLLCNPKTDFSLTSANKPQELPSFISAILKSIVTVELAAQIPGHI